MKIKTGNILLKILLPVQITSDMIALDKSFLSLNFVKFVAQNPGVAAEYTLFWKVSQLFI